MKIWDQSQSSNKKGCYREVLVIDRVGISHYLVPTYPNIPEGVYFLILVYLGFLGESGMSTLPKFSNLKFGLVHH